jgi:RNA polymerase sigma-70 factor (ECF subfamily)
MPFALVKNTTASHSKAQMTLIEAEDDLVEAARSNPAAFGELYRRYVVRVYRYLFSHVGLAEAAEDLTSQVFCAAWEGMAHYQERGSFTAWLFRIARNKANDHFRRQRPDLPLDETVLLLGEEFDPLASLEKSEALHRLAELVTRLAPGQLELLRLRFAADLSFGQIASLLGRNEGSVKMSFYRLLEHLRSEWEKYDE